VILEYIAFVYMPHNHKYKIHRVKDNNEKKIVKKGNLFDLPFRVLYVAKSGVGKSNHLTNMVIKPEYYGNNFKGENIYIFSPSIKLDKKLQIIIKQKNIPNENLFTKLDHEDLATLLEFIEEEYDARKADGKPVEHALVIVDDCMPSMKDKQNSGFQDLFIRSRHFCCSVIATAQYYNKVPPVCRNNLSGLICFEVNTKQLEDIYFDHSYTDKKEFYSLYRKAVSPNRHSTFIVNYSNRIDKMYLDSNFEPITQDEETKQ
jgi:hypothetical protein